jgi:hypothetical protein
MVFQKCHRLRTVDLKMSCEDWQQIALDSNHQPNGLPILECCFGYPFFEVTFELKLSRHFCEVEMIVALDLDSGTVRRAADLDVFEVNLSFPRRKHET